MKENQLKIKRWKTGIKQYELASLLQCSSPYLSMVENNRVDPPLEFKLKVARLLKVSLEELFPIQS
jgi:DNA-binding XRE family transcriptional regulator